MLLCTNYEIQVHYYDLQVKMKEISSGSMMNFTLNGYSRDRVSVQTEAALSIMTGGTPLWRVPHH